MNIIDMKAHYFNANIGKRVVKTSTELNWGKMNFDDDEEELDELMDDMDEGLPIGSAVSSIQHSASSSKASTPPPSAVTGSRSSNKRKKSSSSQPSGTAQPNAARLAYAMGKVSKKKFEPEQVEVLLRRYAESQTPTRQEIEAIAKEIGSNDEKVRNWFSNQRNKKKSGNTSNHDSLAKARQALAENRRQKQAAKEAMAAALVNSRADRTNGGNSETPSSRQMPPPSAQTPSNLPPPSTPQSETPANGQNTGGSSPTTSVPQTPTTAPRSGSRRAGFSRSGVTVSLDLENITSFTIDQIPGGQANITALLESKYYRPELAAELAAAAGSSSSSTISSVEDIAASAAAISAVEREENVHDEDEDEGEGEGEDMDVEPDEIIDAARQRSTPAPIPAPPVVLSLDRNGAQPAQKRNTSVPPATPTPTPLATAPLTSISQAPAPFPSSSSIPAPAATLFASNAVSTQMPLIPSITLANPDAELQDATVGAMLEMQSGVRTSMPTPTLPAISSLKMANPNALSVGSSSSSESSSSEDPDDEDDEERGRRGPPSDDDNYSSGGGAGGDDDDIEEDEVDDDDDFDRGHYSKSQRAGGGVGGSARTSGFTKHMSISEPEVNGNDIDMPTNRVLSEEAQFKIDKFLTGLDRAMFESVEGIDTDMIQLPFETQRSTSQTISFRKSLKRLGRKPCGLKDRYVLKEVVKEVAVAAF
ncbi:hypothetical protein HDU97_005495 [Phlyctochytrium planicorne]|nr:hypothetical protein HDU97_005495 [Phlyctochytrium planicorne]